MTEITTRHFGTLLSAALLAILLTSCNTTEALTPQVDVGGGLMPSSRVTQADTERMASAPAPQQSGGYNSYTDDNRGSSYRQPQNTLEAQARALQSGNSVSPASSGPPPQQTGDTAEPQPRMTGAQMGGPEPMVPAEPAPQNAETAPPAPPAAAEPDPAPASFAAGTIRFLPIIGAPVQSVTPLSRQLGAQARASGLTIRSSSDTSTEHILKGYFSAFADSGKVTIVYVWDILDNSGSRLHRMQGQETVPSKAQDPWSAVPAGIMEAIAVKTINDYVAWRQAQSG